MQDTSKSEIKQIINFYLRITWHTFASVCRYEGAG